MTMDSPRAPVVRGAGVYYKASKTDPFQWGVLVYLGRTNSMQCPVGAVHGSRLGWVHRAILKLHRGYICQGKY